MTSTDKQKLRTYGETRKAALEAAKTGEPAEVAILDGLLADPITSFSGFDLTGRWQCRTIKVGGKFLPLIVYDWFKCRVTDDGAGWKLEKTTGSQRTTGRFYDDGEKRLIYLGSFHVNDDPAKPYGSGPETDQVGYAFRSGARHWRIELPSPYFESQLDIIELRR